LAGQSGALDGWRDVGGGNCPSTQVGCPGYDPGTNPGGGNQFNPNINYGSLADSRNNKTYKTVTIGSQTWMAENLSYDVPNVITDVCYDNSAANCTKYGRLYDWATAMNLASTYNSSSASGQIQAKHQGVCPTGWHIPTNAEWDRLYRYADGTTGTESPYSSPTAGTKLKSSTGWNSYSGVPVGADTYGFAALPGGYGSSYGSFASAGNRGRWWSASEDDASSAYIRRMDYNYEIANWGGNNKSELFSVRCAQD